MFEFCGQIISYTENVAFCIKNTIFNLTGKEGNVLFNDTLNTFYFTIIWHRTYGKGPLRERERERERERKPAATT